MRLGVYVGNCWPCQTLDFVYSLCIVKQSVHNRFQHKGYRQVYNLITIEVGIVGVVVCMSCGKFGPEITIEFMNLSG